MATLTADQAAFMLDASGLAALKSRARDGERSHCQLYALDLSTRFHEFRERGLSFVKELEDRESRH